MNGFRDASTIARDPQFERKYRAVALLFDKLKYQSLHPASPQDRPTTPTSAATDIEIVTDHHGASCATALGISEALPVKIKLASSGNGKSDAWFRFEPASGGLYLFTTNSAGTDPAIAAFSGCANTEQPIAGNDDTFGLDAALTVEIEDHAALFVHLTNSGAAGATQVSVVATTGTINGSVKDAKTALPLTNAYVYLLQAPEYGYITSASTDQTGNYTLATVTPGTYYVGVEASAYVSELYPSITCLPSYYYSWQNCDFSAAHSFAVAANQTISSIDFSLSMGQQILGQVRDTTNQPVPSATVSLNTSTGVSLESTYSDTAGHYSFSTIPADDYTLQAQANGYGSQMYADIACDGPLQLQCDFTKASALHVANQNAVGVNFNLPTLSSISGTVSGAGGSTIASAQITVVDSSGTIVAQSSSGNNGQFSAGPIAIGTYYIYASAAGYFAQLSAGIDCGPDCTQSLATASPISIVFNGQQAQANFSLDLLPAVSGYVQDAVSGLPLANVTVAASLNPPAVGFYPVSSAQTGSNGDFTLLNVPAGSYYVWALSDDHVDQIYSGIACESSNGSYYYPAANCDVTGATLLTIASGANVGPMNFSLNPSSSISGTATTRAGSGSDLAAAVNVTVYSGSGSTVANATTDANGNYIVSDLPPGTYYVAAQSYYGPQFVGQMWQQIDCSSTCVPTTGTPIFVTQGVNVATVDFLMTRLDAVVGRVTDTRGNPIAGALVDLFNSTNKSYVGSGIADAQGYYAAPGNVGYSFDLATEAGIGYIDQVYSAISCPLGSAYYALCPLTSALPVSLGSTATQPHIVNFVLKPNDAIFANGFESP
ncbi:MAG: carboxypeptidase regulatory-like domain-containing protein [Rudaea sp.]|nr:carboxypeptidase regulatory-like domain-containing protein [Rudaea sp.]